MSSGLKFTTLISQLPRGKDYGYISTTSLRPRIFYSSAYNFLVSSLYRLQEACLCRTQYRSVKTRKQINKKNPFQSEERLQKFTKGTPGQKKKTKIPKGNRRRKKFQTTSDSQLSSESKNRNCIEIIILKITAKRCLY